MTARPYVSQLHQQHSMADEQIVILVPHISFGCLSLAFRVSLNVWFGIYICDRSGNLGIIRVKFKAC